MWLKVLIVVEFILVLISLTSAGYFLFKDLGQGKRALYALGARITMAALLLGTIAFGYYTGRLEISAPWDARLQQQQSAQQPAPNPAD